MLKIYLSDRNPVIGMKINPAILLIVPTIANLYSFSSQYIPNCKRNVNLVKNFRRFSIQLIVFIEIQQKWQKARRNLHRKS